MKIISLNTWGARAGHEEFLGFIKKQSESVDVFCFQEVWHVHSENGQKALELYRASLQNGIVKANMMTDLFIQMSNVLPNHVGYFRPHYGDHYGLAMFVRKDIDLIEEGDIFVYKDRDYKPTEDVSNHARNIQYVTLKTKNGLRTIINFHGQWNGKGKTDTEDRLLQSENIISFLKTLKTPFVLIGDFNLLPDTESLKKFEKYGLRNLISENGITSTRTSLYEKEHRFADYAFTSEGIVVKNFKVLPEEVSDHSALYLEV